MRILLWGVGGLLLVAVLAAHSGALHGGFHYDDLTSIKENFAIRVWQPLFYLTSPRAVSGAEGASGYRPLIVASFAVNYALGQLDPWGYLFGNLLLHLAVSWMVFVLGRVLLRDDRWAAVAAVIYALHPVNAEAINYVVARSSLLAALGALVAFWAFLHRRGGGGVWWTVVGLAAFAAALLSKESAVALLPALAASHWLGEPGADGRGSRGTPTGRWVRPVIPYVVVFVVYLAVWWSVVAANMGQRGGDTAVFPVWTVMELVGRSLWLWVWPWPLGLDHPLTFLGRFDAVLAAALVVAAVGMGTVVLACRRRAPLLAWGMVWALAGLAPLAPLPWMTRIGLLQENRLAFSAAALAWLTAAAMRRIIVYGSIRAASGGARPRVAWWIRGAAAVIGGAMLAGAVVVDRARSAVWNDDVRLWEEAVRLSPESRNARVELGAIRMARQEYDQAEVEFRRALALSPGYARAYYMLGLLAVRRERYDEADALMAKTIALAPKFLLPYRVLGDVAMKRGQAQAAEAAFQRALALNPRDAEAQAKLGLLAQQAGDLGVAETFYLAALVNDPDQPLARNNLGIFYARRQDLPRALEQFTAVVRRNPDDLEAAYNQAMTLNAMGKEANARVVAEALLRRLSPDPQFDGYRRGAQALIGGGGP